MRAVRFASPASRDLASILRRSRFQFGEQVASNYALLIRSAVDEIRNDPFRPASNALTRPRRDIRRYAVRFARGTIPADQRIGRPRHILIYEVFPDELVVLRIVHDAMDQRRLRLPRS